MSSTNTVKHFIKSILEKDFLRGAHIILHEIKLGNKDIFIENLKQELEKKDALTIIKYLDRYHIFLVMANAIELFLKRCLNSRHYKQKTTFHPKENASYKLTDNMKDELTLLKATIQNASLLLEARLNINLHGKHIEKAESERTLLNTKPDDIVILKPAYRDNVDRLENDYIYDLFFRYTSPNELSMVEFKTIEFKSHYVTFEEDDIDVQHKGAVDITIQNPVIVIHKLAKWIRSEYYRNSLNANFTHAALETLSAQSMAFIDIPNQAFSAFSIALAHIDSLFPNAPRHLKKDIQRLGQSIQEQASYYDDHPDVSIAHYLFQLKIQLDRKQWNTRGIGLFGHKTPDGIGRLRDALSNLPNESTTQNRKTFREIFWDVFKILKEKQSPHRTVFSHQLPVTRDFYRSQLLLGINVREILINKEASFINDSAEDNTALNDGIEKMTAEAIVDQEENNVQSITHYLSQLKTDLDRKQWNTRGIGLFCQKTPDGIKKLRNALSSLHNASTIENHETLYGIFRKVYSILKEKKNPIKGTLNNRLPVTQDFYCSQWTSCEDLHNVIKNEEETVLEDSVNATYQERHSASLFKHQTTITNEHPHVAAFR